MGDEARECVADKRVRLMVEPAKAIPPEGAGRAAAAAAAAWLGR